MKFRFKISESGEFSFQASRAWINMKMKELAPGDYDFVVKKHKKQRSLSQNAYYWAVVVPMVYEGLRAAGYDEVTSEEDAHEVIKPMFFKKVIYSEKHDALEKIESSADFSTAEFSEKMEQIAVWAFDFLGITIPPPNSQMSIEYYEQNSDSK